jgi:hypothetical protein
MSESTRILVLLSAQRALLSHVPPSLRAVSVDFDEHRIYLRCIFDGEPTEEDLELMSFSATEIIASFAAPYTVDEQYLTVNFPHEMDHLAYLVYLRHE